MPLRLTTALQSRPFASTSYRDTGMGALRPSCQTRRCLFAAGSEPRKSGARHAVFLAPWDPQKPSEDLGERPPKGGGPLGSGEKGQGPSFSFPCQAGFGLCSLSWAFIQRERSSPGPPPSGWWASDGPLGTGVQKRQNRAWSPTLPASEKLRN